MVGYQNETRDTVKGSESGSTDPSGRFIFGTGFSNRVTDEGLPGFDFVMGDIFRHVSSERYSPLVTIVQ